MRLVNTICGAALLLVCIGGHAAQQSGSSHLPGRYEGAPPQVTVAAQPESPLSVTYSTRWSTPQGEILDFYIDVKNIDRRAVRSYATRVVATSGKGTREICYIHNVPAPGKVLQAGQYDGKSRFTGFEKNPQNPTLSVSVDYVEFTDGSSWGEDSCQAAEQLKGARAGGRAAIDTLLKLLEGKGPESVIEVVRGERAFVKMPSGRSAKWEEGFRGGVDVIRYRVKDVYEREGSPEIEPVLRKPYDAADAEAEKRL